MVVKDFITSNVELLMDILIREIIKSNSSYVRVDNELHFDDYILRFHEQEECERNFVTIPLEVSECISKNYFLNVKDLIKETTEYTINDINKPSYHINKKLIKMQNKVNNRLINTRRK